LVTAEAQSFWADPFLHWKSVTPNLDVILVPGTHYDVLEEPYAPVVAAALSGVLSV
jgi:thioesterase domain-containing protein